MIHDNDFFLNLGKKMIIFNWERGLNIGPWVTLEKPL